MGDAEALSRIATNTHRQDPPLDKPAPLWRKVVIKMVEQIPAANNPERSSPLMNGLSELRSTALSLRSVLTVVLTPATPTDSNVKAIAEDTALSVIAEIQDILASIHDRLVV